MTQTKRPEIGATVVANGIKTNYLEDGKGSPVVFIHGSGPGVTAYANWRLVMPGLAPHFRTLAPDMVGFGYTERPDGINYDIQVWADQVTGFLDALDIRTASLVGNSFGGAIALRVVTQHPERVDKLVLMGSIGVPFPITEGLDRVWGYQPSVENMKKMLGIFAYSPELANDHQLARVRYEASIQPGFQEAFSSMFPPPRQTSVDEMVIPDDELRKIGQETLIVHGRDDKVIPLDTSLRLLHLIDRSQLHVFGRCGHWTQIERAGDFVRLVDDFLSRSAEQTGTVTAVRLPAHRLEERREELRHAPHAEEGPARQRAAQQGFRPRTAADRQGPLHPDIPDHGAHAGRRGPDGQHVPPGRDARLGLHRALARGDRRRYRRGAAAERLPGPAAPRSWRAPVAGDRAAAGHRELPRQGYRADGRAGRHLALRAAGPQHLQPAEPHPGQLPGRDGGGVRIQVPRSVL